MQTIDIQKVEFDVSVTVEQHDTSGRHGGFSLRVIEADFDKDKSVKSIGESRVKFSVPISLPATKVEAPKTPGPQSTGNIRSVSAGTENFTDA